MTDNRKESAEDLSSRLNILCLTLYRVFWMYGYDTITKRVALLKVLFQDFSVDNLHENGLLAVYEGDLSRKSVYSVWPSEGPARSLRLNSHARLSLGMTEPPEKES